MNGKKNHPLLASLDEITSTRFKPRNSLRIQNKTVQNQIPIRFVEESEELGVNFQYDISKDLTAGMEHIFETTGGGIGVLDFDQDGRVDIYFAQGCDWRKRTFLSGKSDELYRNMGESGFNEISEDASIREFRFSQGVAAGDLNADGFDDLYICNLGENSCFINNGDGTFTESATILNNSTSAWSLSAGIADLNGDSLADLYVVNYLDSEEVANRVCKHESQPRACAPTMFKGSQDQLYISDGVGGFFEYNNISRH